MFRGFNFIFVKEIKSKISSSKSFLIVYPKRNCVPVVSGQNNRNLSIEELVWLISGMGGEILSNSRDITRLFSKFYLYIYIFFKLTSISVIYLHIYSLSVSTVGIFLPDSLVVNPEENKDSTGSQMQNDTNIYSSDSFRTICSANWVIESIVNQKVLEY